MRIRSLVGCSLVGAAAALLLAGCTILQSSEDETASGIPYYLPKSVIVAEVIIKQKGSNVFVEFDTTSNKTRGEIIPDQSQRLLLAYSSNPFYNDRYCISTDGNNLLTSIEYATEDATPKIALALATLGQKGPQAFAATVEGETVLVDTVKVTFDPFDLAETATAETALTDAVNAALPADSRVNVRFDFAGIVRATSIPRPKCRNDRGVCFRAKLKVPMRLVADAAGGARAGKVSRGAPTIRFSGPSPTVYVDVVNMVHTGHFDLDRTFMVEKVVRLGFESGALSQVIMRKPSEALETVKLPLAIADAILAVPANFVAKAGPNANLNAILTAQQTTLNALQVQLATQMASGSIGYEGAYKETCKGRVFNK